jgi:glycosyltransferase involved in cell wall biosynthesis
MKFSLITATLGRRDEVILLLKSLDVQTFKNFELIIVDQNDDDRVLDACTQFKDKISIQYIKSSIKGLSVNRNIGMEYITGDIAAFPDDDCEYETDTLENVAGFFSQNPSYSFYTCNTRDKTGSGAILNAKTTDADISIHNFLNVGISFTIFARISAVSPFKFDEKLGVGTLLSSGEESDLLLFLLKNNNKGRYHAGNYIYHPAKPETAEKALLYGKGFGAVYKKALTKYHFYILLPVFILRLIKGCINIIFYSNKKIRLASLKGRFMGFVQYK